MLDAEVELAVGTAAFEAERDMEERVEPLNGKEQQDGPQLARKADGSPDDIAVEAKAGSPYWAVDCAE